MAESLKKQKDTEYLHQKHCAISLRRVSARFIQVVLLLHKQRHDSLQAVCLYLQLNVPVSVSHSETIQAPT